MRILLTGTAGRIGRAIHVRLSPVYDIIGLDRSPASTVDIVGDVTNSALLSSLCAGVNAIVHTAALHAPHVGIVSDAEFERINVEATQKLIETAIACRVPRIIFTSTTALYGSSARASDSAVWVDENTHAHPLTIYHRTKLAAEALLQTAAKEYGLAVRILRMSRCFPEPAPQMAVYRLYRGVDARDVADAHALALEDVGEGCNTYIISGTTPFQRDDCSALWHSAPTVLARCVPELVRDFARRGWELPARIDRVYDSSKAQRELGWEPRFGYSNVLSLFDQCLSEVLPAVRLRP
ncbi:MAG: NAD(P)-dependent oxidoreductase [Ignavibacteria bacterium]|nr:NAD(P)-dependent oxidoreductase [Ignavibacteria bacterium]